MKQLLLPALALALLTQCHKSAPNPAKPEDQLPPATQTGANTFGCLVNGQAYLPAGRVGLGSNYSVSYDPTFNGGDLIVRTYRATGTDDKDFVIGGTSISRPGTYSFGTGTTLRTFFGDNKRSIPCDVQDNRDANTFSKGTFTITRLDLQAGIVAGTFSFLLAKPGCDTLKVTQGRFDYKL
jgi:hypothetical protein